MNGNEVLQWNSSESTASSKDPWKELASDG